MSSLATTLNGKVPSWRSIFKILGGGLLASVLFVLAAIGLPNWLKWVPETLYFIAMSVTIFGVLCISVRATLVAAERLKALSEEAIAAVDIRNKVGAIIPLEALPQGFESKAIAAATDELPAVRGEWRSILADEKILKEYAEYIDQRRNAVTYEVFSAINRFNRDRTLLIEQRKNVLRRAFRAQRFVRRFKDLPKISVTFSTLPEFERLSIPPQPPLS